jgi:hypothetical protein
MSERLCKHVTFEYDDIGALQVLEGIAVPIWGWSPDEQGDVPLLRCANCEATGLIEAGVVRLNRGAWRDRKAEGGQPGDDDDMLWDDDDDMDWDDDMDEDGGIGWHPHDDWDWD